MLRSDEFAERVKLKITCGDGNGAGVKVESGEGIPPH